MENVWVIYIYILYTTPLCMCIYDRVENFKSIEALPFTPGWDIEFCWSVGIKLANRG